nr:unnamed protein product [Callosobruchus analis]
MHKQKLRSSRM